MDLLLALSLAIATAEPALAGGPHAPVEQTQTRTVERYCDPSAGRSSCRERAQRRHAQSAPHADSSGGGEPARQIVQLDDGFFVGGLAGGVEQPLPAYRYHGHRVVVIGPGHATPRSAGQAAAARGLPRP